MIYLCVLPDPRGPPPAGRGRLDQRDHPRGLVLARLQPPPELRGHRAEAGGRVRVPGAGQEQIRVERGIQDIPLLRGKER